MIEDQELGYPHYQREKFIWESAVVSTPMEVLYLLTLNKYLDCNGTGADPREKVLAKEMRCHVDTVKKTALSLIEKGVLSKEARFYPGTRAHRSNLYSIIFTALQLEVEIDGGKSRVHGGKSRVPEIYGGTMRKEQSNDRS
jgi:hypothetical protein